LGATLVACVSASLVGGFVSLRSGRNLLPASMQAAGYCAPYLAAWALFGAAVINSALRLYLTGWYRLAQQWTRINADELVAWSCLLPNAVCGLLLLICIGQVTTGARHANR